MVSILPAFPRLVFTVLEPISLVAGALTALVSPDWFVGQQLFQRNATLALCESDHSRLVAMQLGNLFLLLSLVGLAVFSSTTEPKVVRRFLWALWVADIGHLAVTYRVMGHTSFTDIQAWNAMTWGNIAATGFLFLTRTLYFMGLFGPDRKSPARPKVH